MTERGRLILYTMPIGLVKFLTRGWGYGSLLDF